MNIEDEVARHCSLDLCVDKALSILDIQYIVSTFLGIDCAYVDIEYGDEKVEVDNPLVWVRYFSLLQGDFPYAIDIYSSEVSLTHRAEFEVYRKICTHFKCNGILLYGCPKPWGCIYFGKGGDSFYASVDEVDPDEASGAVRDDPSYFLFEGHAEYWFCTVFSDEEINPSLFAEYLSKFSDISTSEISVSESEDNEYYDICYNQCYVFKNTNKMESITLYENDDIVLNAAKAYSSHTKSRLSVYTYNSEMIVNEPNGTKSIHFCCDVIGDQVTTRKCGESP